MSHNDLKNYYRTIFNMNKYHNFTPDVVENMIPFERDLYQDMILSDIQKQQQEAEKRSGVIRAFE